MVSGRFHISTRFWVVYVLGRASGPRGGPFYSHHLVRLQGQSPPGNGHPYQAVKVSIANKQARIRNHGGRHGAQTGTATSLCMYVKGVLLLGSKRKIIQCADWTVS